MDCALYIHFPFCVRKCLYCDFGSLAGSSISPEEYVAVLMRELELRAATLDGTVTASTLYFGGGTPSLMASESVKLVIDWARRWYGLLPGAEVTLEANPGTIDREKLAGYRAAGVNRLSLGVQSFDDAILGRLGRLHTARQAADAVTLARQAGFANLGIDLIHGLPGQSVAMWRDDLARAVDLAPEHISAYGLTVEEGTPFHDLARNGQLDLPDEDTALEMLEMTSDLLRETGYEQYEISNFARPGCRSRHNQVYWHRGEYLGFGAGAHSFLRMGGWGRRWHNPRQPAVYMQAMADGLPPAEEPFTLDRHDAMAEFMFLGLRLLEGIELSRFREEFGVAVNEAYGAEVDYLTTSGLLELVDDRLRLTRAGLPLANQVFQRFL
ncbi:radical SAM family heme chaperone HemW [Geobacter sp. AOG1]|uniref:radical SAM family heme chaperone HemW n=1 Tax=Geobacter sp. AOG1 TaxID=1566346 RepID=UPI001CC461F6|nr:radical SAM family heme chaperone HemW [Geobacter sp. AOG1]GFE57043.1 coproporphyrinogen III oxidase [Geobacter sp. AOG1]